ncbi:MAG: hypothetical protein AUK47_26840 [Deltaproteobacteria bacterium CG2_30_63_29]|nr:MAG: hypothetical protein AUK47_26840 [Deltaproteobacteria bacterium CG2_30_63_29]
MNPERVVLITGLPTFAARHLLLTLVEREPNSNYYIIVPEHLRERLQSSLTAPLPDNVSVFTGDTVQIDLGLSGPEYVEIIDNVTDVYHMASIFYIGVDVKQARRVNVDGTLNMLQAASEMPNLNRFNHFSTAFVSGDRTGVIMESELNLGQKFRNPFERTKYEAEILIQKWRERLPITIFRPTLIVGDSRTGEIDRTSMSGPYTLMKTMLGAPVDVAIPLPGKGDKPLNLVPIDWVCESIHVLSRLEEAVDKTFHLADSNPLSARAVFELVAVAGDRRLPRGRVPYPLSKLVLDLPFIKRLFLPHKQFLEDFNQLAIFNLLNTTTLLEGQGRTCPPLSTYIGRLVRYMVESGL